MGEKESRRAEHKVGSSGGNKRSCTHPLHTPGHQCGAQLLRSASGKVIVG